MFNITWLFMQLSVSKLRIGGWNSKWGCCQVTELALQPETGTLVTPPLPLSFPAAGNAVPGKPAHLYPVTCNRFYLSSQRIMYKLLRRLLFCFPTESVHYFSMNMMKMGCSVGPVRKSISSQFTPNKGELSKELFGLRFKNPVGLAAGFDKNALYLF